MAHTTDKLAQRKAKYKEIITLLSKGHNFSSAGRIVGFSTQHISKLSKTPYFRRKLAEAEIIATGNIKHSLIQRATGMKLQETYETLDKHGNKHELTSIKEIPPDMKAAEMWLQAKDPSGNWGNNSNQVNIQLNQQLQGVSTQDLLLTLSNAKTQGVKEIEGGGGREVEGVVEEKESLSTQPFSRGYNSDWDEIHQKLAPSQDTGMSDEEYLKEMIENSSDEG